MFKPAVMSNIPPNSSLPKVKRQDMSPEIREIFPRVPRRYGRAVSKMVSYVMATTGKGIYEVKVEDIVTEDVASAMIEYSKSMKQLLHCCRFVYRLLGENDLLPHPQKIYDEIHPELLAWIEVCNLSSEKVVSVRATCMKFIHWVSQHTVPSSAPHAYPLVYLQRHHLMEYRKHLLLSVQKGQRSYPTARWHLQLVVRWVKWLIQNQRIGDIDLTGLTIKNTPSRERRIPTHLQITKFMEALINSSIKDEYLLFFLLLMETGARPIELRKLTMDCVNTQNHSIRLQSKGGPERWMILGENLWKLLALHISKREENGTGGSLYVLHGSTGQTLNFSVIHLHYTWAKAESGIDIDGLMVFRHRFATDCYEAKVPTAVFQYVMGHRSLQELKRYQHSNEYFDKKEVDSAVTGWMGDMT